MKIVSWIQGKAQKMLGIASALAFAVILMASGGEKVGAAPVTFTDTTLPFTVGDMLSTAINFLTLYGEWVLLAIGVLFSPVLFSLAMKLVNAVRAKMARV